MPQGNLFTGQIKMNGKTGVTKYRDHVGREEELSKVKAKDLRQLLDDQAYQCALTGRVLSPETAAVDHIHPIGKGGLHSIDNLQILDSQVNLAKGTMTQEEFIQMCKEVVLWACSQNCETHQELLSNLELQQIICLNRSRPQASDRFLQRA